MGKIRKRIKSIIAMTLVVTTIITSGLNFKIVANAETVNNTVTSNYGLAGNTEDGVILHAWDWSFNTVKDNLEDIAKAGYTSVQVSPIQPSKNDNYTTNSKWYILYQPIAFEIGNKQLGTEEEFKAMCDEADKYGIKIIVDVVANHTGNNEGDGNTTIAPQVKFQGAGFEDYWHNPLHGVTDWDDRKEVTHGGIGLPDLNTSNKDVQKMVRNYLEECLKDGADGFRFDAAKHIELPTDKEGISSDFWPSVLDGLKTTDGTNPYIYGEVLQGGADNYAEYTKIMHVTTSNYGNNIRKAVGLGTSANVSNAIDYDVPPEVNPSRLVTWVESHDTYANDSEESTGMTSEQIKDGWAIIAARADSTPLYFNRTAGRKKLQGNIGDAGNDDWKDPDVVAVNKFHNDMADEDENLVKVSKEILMIERGNKGVVIVNLANDCSINQDINLEDGIYNNCATSGGTFSVKGGKISGTLSKGITVLYKDGVPEKPSTSPKVSISEEDCSFEGTLDLTLNVTNSTNATYSINDGQEIVYTNGQQITIGQDAEAGDKIKVVVKAVNEDRKASEEYNYIKKDSNSVATLYFRKPDGWMAPYVYIYNELDEEDCAWPGNKMTKIDDDLYKYELKGFTDSKVMFNDWFYGGNKTEELDLTATGKMLYDSSKSDKWSATEDIEANPNVKPDVEEKSTSKVYLKKPADWENDDIYIYFYKNGASGPAWPGIPMEKVEGKDDLYTYTLPKGLEGAMVLFNCDGGSVQVPKDTGFKAPANTTMIYDESWKEYTENSSKVYFRKPAEWGEPNVYAYKSSGGENEKWPGAKMEKVSATETLYSYTLPENFGDCNVIFNDGSNKYPSKEGYALSVGDVKIYDNDGLRDFTLDDLEEPEQPSDDEEQGVTKVYFENTFGWDKVKVYAYNDGTSDEVKAWPGVNAKDEGDNLYSYTLPNGFESATVIFNNGSGGEGNQTGNLKTEAGHTMIYDAENDVLKSLSKVYFKNTEKWDKVKVHYWIDGGASTNWPGMSMTYEGDDLYSYTLPDDFQNVNVIFNNNSNGMQSETVKIKEGETLIFIPSLTGSDDNREGEWRVFEKSDISNSSTNPDPDEPDTDEEVGSTVYVKLPEGWSGIPNMHYWNVVGGQTEWPGKAMKDEGNGIYSCEIPKSFGDVSIIINDGKNKLTDSEGKSEFPVKLGSSIIFEDGIWRDYVKPNPDPEDPDDGDNDNKEVSKAPKINGDIYTTTTNVTGTAGANAEMILTVDEIVETTTSDGVTLKTIKDVEKKEIGSAKADENGRWSANISKQEKGTVITITATEEDKEPASIEVTVKKKSSSSSSGSTSSSSSKKKTSKPITISRVEDALSNAIKGNINIDSKKPYIEKDVFDFLAKNPNKTITLIGNGYSWTFKGSDINSSMVLSEDIVTTISNVSPKQESINKLAKGNDILTLHFDYEGLLPGKASVQINVDSKYNDSIMNLYIYNEKLNKLELLSENIEVKNNNINIEVLRGADYILSKTKIPGVIKSGWNLNENNAWIFIENSDLVKGWKLVDNKWYLMDANGIMRTGWNLINSKWYYLNGSGAMETGWLCINDKWYYLANNGVMLSNTTINGYILGNDGVWIK